MAYQARQRDPFLDSDMQAAIERRGKELFGLALLAFGILVTLILISYVPEDPSSSLCDRRSWCMGHSIRDRHLGTALCLPSG